MRLAKVSSLLAASTVVAGSASGAVILDNIQFRSSVFGPTTPAGATLSGVTYNGGAPGVISGQAALNVELTVSDIDIEGDSSANDSVTFTVQFTPASGADNIRAFGQGLDRGFGNADGILAAVTAVSGTTTDGGETIVFDGFTGASLGGGAGGGAAIQRTVDINGTPTTISADADPNAGFRFITEFLDFAPTATVLFDNQSGGTGSVVARSYDLQFSSVVPEPASLALVGLGGLAMLGRRRG